MTKITNFSFMWILEGYRSICKTWSQQIVRYELKEYSIGRCQVTSRVLNTWPHGLLEWKQRQLHSNAPITLHVSIHEVPGCPTDSLKWMTFQTELDLGRFFIHIGLHKCGRERFRNFNSSRFVVVYMNVCMCIAIKLHLNLSLLWWWWRICKYLSFFIYVFF